MAVRFYMDEQVQSAITRALRSCGVDVLTAQEDGKEAAFDPELLDRATALGRVIFTRDDDFLREATRRQRSGIAFAGVVYAHPLRATLGECVKDLKLISAATGPRNTSVA